MTNREKAWLHFYPEGNGCAKKGYVLHHKDHMMRFQDPARYNEWCITDLVMITRSEHTALHNNLKQYTSISDAHKKLYLIFSKAVHHIGEESIDAPNLMKRRVHQ